MFVGGLGEREGGSGTLMSALGAGKRLPKTGADTERLFMVFLRPAAATSTGGVGVGLADFLGGCFRGGVDMERRDDAWGDDSDLKAEDGFLTVGAEDLRTLWSLAECVQGPGAATRLSALSLLIQVSIQSSRRSLCSR